MIRQYDLVATNKEFVYSPREQGEPLTTPVRYVWTNANCGGLALLIVLVKALCGSFRPATILRFIAARS